MNWKYCECGCHGHEAGASNTWYWIFNDLKGKYHLHAGHGWTSPLIGEFSSFDAAAKEAEKRFKREIKAMEREVR